MILLVFAALAVVALSGRRRFSLVPRPARPVAISQELAEVCDLTAICLTGGLNIATALRIAAGAGEGPISAELEAILARARIDGLGVVLATADGAGARLYQSVSRADVTGGPMLQSVAALADELWSEQATAALEKARRLPVAMLLPLTLLILPGFLLLTIAPAVFDAFSRLSL
jgi:pilus assembly protein TadC